MRKLGGRRKIQTGSSGNVNENRAAFFYGGVRGDLNMAEIEIDVAAGTVTHRWKGILLVVKTRPKRRRYDKKWLSSRTPCFYYIQVFFNMGLLHRLV